MQEGHDAGGGAIPGDDVAPGDAAGGCCYTRRFSRTFIHYITIGTDGTDDTYRFVPTPNQEGVQGTLNLQWAWQNIEYWRLNASMTPNDFQVHFLGTKRWRVKGMGFKISNIIPTTEELGTVGGTTTETLTFNERPYMFIYEDSKHAIFAHSQDNRSDTFDQPNDEFRINNPTTRDEGKLNRIVDQRQVAWPWMVRAARQANPPIEGNDIVGNAEDLLSPFNTDAWATLHTGESWEYEWQNTSKLWFPNMEFTYMGQVRNTMAKMRLAQMVGEVGPWEKYQGTNDWSPGNTVNGNSLWPEDYNTDSAKGATNISKLMTTLLPFSNNSPPPICCLRAPKLLKSDDTPMRLTFQVTCTYTSEVEFDRAVGGGQAAGFMPRCVYAAGSGNTQVDYVDNDMFQPQQQTNLCQWPYNQRGYGISTNEPGGNPLTR